MQEFIVLLLFVAVVSYGCYRIFRKDSSEGCAHCEFNETDS